MKKLPVLGKTPSGQYVVGGIFRLYDTFGIPIWLILAECHLHNLIVGWHQFYIDAIRAGWQHKTIMMRVGADLADADAREFRDEVLARFDKLHTGIN